MKTLSSDSQSSIDAHGIGMVYIYISSIRKFGH